MAERNAIVKAAEYAILKSDPKEIGQIVRENVGRMGLNEFSLSRVVFPSGKGKPMYTIPSLTGDEAVDHIEGIVVGFKDIRVYWKLSIDEGGGSAPPDCFSDDLEVGHGDPGVACAQCPFAAFGSKPGKAGKESKGQACQQRRVLFILRQNSLLPIVLSLPPTSVTQCHKFFVAMIGQGIPFYGALMQIGLNQEKNSGGVDYAEATFKASEILPDDLKQKMKVISEQLRPHFEKAAKAAARQPDAAPGQNVSNATEPKVGNGATAAGAGTNAGESANVHARRRK